MFRDDTIAGSWTQLTARLDAEACVARWSRYESALAGFRSIGEIVAVTVADASGWLEAELDLIGSSAAAPSQIMITRREALTAQLRPAANMHSELAARDPDFPTAGAAV